MKINWKIDFKIQRDTTNRRFMIEKDSKTFKMYLEAYQKMIRIYFFLFLIISLKWSCILKFISRP